MDTVQRMINRLEAGSATFECGGYISKLDPFIRTSIYTRLLFERLQRKNDYIVNLYKNGGLKWEQVVYVLLFRFLGAPANTEAFEKLARLIPYTVTHRYRRSEQSLEALLIGGSGLLDIYPNNTYTQELRVQFEYLSQKHNLQKMSASEWTLNRIYPKNNPVLRIFQLVSILSQPNFDIEAVLACRTAEDVGRLFMHEAEESRLAQFVSFMESAKECGRIGRGKSDILAINVVAPVQFSYGSYIDSDRLRDRALNLLDSTPAENNAKVRRWSNNGLIPLSAFETQVLIQLGDEYCLKRRCRECPVGEQIIKSLKETCKLKENK